MLNAIILAGSQSDESWSGFKNKCLIEINKKTLIEYVIDALKNADDIGKIVVVGPKDDIADAILGKVDDIIDSKGSIVENLMKGISYFDSEEHLLVCSSDIPLLTPATINDFVNKCKEAKGDFCYPVVEKSLNIKLYPELERTYVKVKEGTFTGGNVFYIKSAVIRSSLPLIEKLVDSRKNPLKMARVFGFWFFIKLLLGKLSIEDAEKKVFNILNIKAKCIISEHPEIANDVDKLNDVIAVNAYLSK
ncbi:MAG TPA: NTP transferase domain-containing protein [Clostridium sp.]|jgi:molybdopterin-guanine dinucleotide biosynthesis protein A|nr:NTP transferase domain-containing protein [Clostridium sp.]